MLMIACVTSPVYDQACSALWWIAHAGACICSLVGGTTAMPSSTALITLPNMLLCTLFTRVKHQKSKSLWLNSSLLPVLTITF
jgi:hypothetical protein